MTDIKSELEKTVTPEQLNLTIVEESIVEKEDIISEKEEKIPVVPIVIEKVEEPIVEKKEEIEIKPVIMDEIAEHPIIEKVEEMHQSIKDDITIKIESIEKNLTDLLNSLKEPEKKTSIFEKYWDKFNKVGLWVLIVFLFGITTGAYIMKTYVQYRVHEAIVLKSYLNETNAIIYTILPDPERNNKK